MPLKIVRAAPNGGPIVASIASGFAQAGSYTIYLWEAQTNRVLLESKGNFINPDDDDCPLPLPNGDNHHRIVECITTLAITPPIRDYRVRLSIYQDGQEIGFDEVCGRTDQPSVMVDQFVQLAIPRFA